MPPKTESPRVRPAPVSGFPEWLPEIRMVEQKWLDRDALGGAPFALTAKGETSHEVYALRRPQEGADDAGDSRIGLHFDLTVPLARYTAQHFNELVFSFKRCQMQRVWRGERAQDGRFREFAQCDIGVINVGRLPLHFDAELPCLIHEVMTSLDPPARALDINNRKVLQGFCEGIGISDPSAVIRAVDKLEKVGPEGVAKILSGEVGLSARIVDGLRTGFPRQPAGRHRQRPMDGSA
ncbi:ATP phosphoribosyltransferase regulatory subunit [Streptomyces nojiriensis]|uniref:ATP phosphoribosyltransferase regulatory subunit n=1 Tax=Streptomyces nojiriensis TaxID=66374 RepID=UPI0036482E6E